MLGSETGHADLLVHQCMQSVWVLLLIDILGTNSANGHLRLGVTGSTRLRHHLAPVRP